MKSIIEEAPSILKAIEKAWIRAGNPVEFSVKIFEDSQKNFFGMTSKNAKVGVFFEIEPIRVDNTRQATHGSPAYAHGEPRVAQKDDAKHKKPLLRSSPLRQSSEASFEGQTQAQQHRAATSEFTRQTPVTQQKIEVDALQENGQEGSASSSELRKISKRVAWNDEMLTAVSTWLKELLKISDLGSHQPTLTVLDNRLIILFANPLFDDPAQASDLYRSLSYLLIGMIRSKFKREFRFLKIVLTDGLRDRDNNES